MFKPDDAPMLKFRNFIDTEITWRLAHAQYNVIGKIIIKGEYFRKKKDYYIM